jgi:hypothetical protein
MYGRITAGAVTIMLGLAGTAHAEPAVPTFVNGLSQAVFAQGSANWVNHELWVETTMDTDLDGRRDRVHVDVSRPMETQTDGLKVPVIYEDSPYYAGGADITNWAVDHEIGVPPTSRVRAPDFSADPTSPTISTIYESTWVPRGFAVVHSESPGTGHSDGCPNSGAPIETEGAKAVIDWLNGRAKGYTTRAGDVEVTADWTTGKVGMIGTSYNGTLPRGSRRSCRSRRSPTGTTTTAPTAWCARPAASRARTSTSSPSTSTRAPTRARTARSAGRRSTRSRPTRTG